MTNLKEYVKSLIFIVLLTLYTDGAQLMLGLVMSVQKCKMNSGLIDAVENGSFKEIRMPGPNLGQG